MNEIRRIIFESGAPGSALYAVLIAHDRGRGFEVTEHCHDYYEMMYVLAGEAIHGINGVQSYLKPGDMIFLRPDKDFHYVKFRPGRKLYYINLCFPADAWADFKRAGGVDETLDSAPTAIRRELIGRAAEVCGGLFEEAMHRYQSATEPTPRLELCRFLCGILPYLVTEHSQDDEQLDDFGGTAPLWLQKACYQMKHYPVSLQEGLPRLIQLAGVHPSHLARVLKSLTGKTPTEYINDLRLARAALLLTTTPLSIGQIAGECGFDQLSYFYRLFGKRYGHSPHAHRVAARRSVTPSL